MREYEQGVHEYLARLQSEVDELRARVETESAERLKLGEEREQYRRLYMEALERCKTLERGIIAGRKAESYSGQDGQLALQVLEQLLGAEPDDGASTPEAEAASRDERPRPRPKPTGRKPLPEHLPRVEIEVLPPEVEREGLNAFERIGEETRETLEHRPASVVVVRVVRPKFVRRGDATEQEPVVLIADAPELPIERGLAGPGMLSDSTVRRWGDHCPISKALNYAHNQRVALVRFLDDGRLPMTNNISERHLRREAIGRKNWLFVGSDDGARTNTIFVSLLASCQLHGIEPRAYLRDLFCLLPSWPKKRALELAPAYWRETLEHEDTQQRLAANVYRSVTLEHSPPE